MGGGIHLGRVSFLQGKQPFQPAKFINAESTLNGTSQRTFVGNSVCDRLPHGSLRSCYPARLTQDGIGEAARGAYTMQPPQTGRADKTQVLASKLHEPPRPPSCTDKLGSQARRATDPKLSKPLFLLPGANLFSLQTIARPVKG